MKAFSKILVAVLILFAFGMKSQQIFASGFKLTGGPYKVCPTQKPTDGNIIGDGTDNVYASTYSTTERKWSQPEKLNVNGKMENKATKKNNFIVKEESGNSDLYLSNLVNGTWTPPQKMGAPINSEFSESSACLTSDGAILYFSSNRPGGFGGYDIYKCERQENGEWGPAVNLGKSVNTPKDEETPYILTDDLTLYFSSQGHGSIGGYDVYVSTLNDDGFWGRPENLNFPVNSNINDLFFSLSDDENLIYITRY
ncbi:MAG: hypothetical protein V2A54_17710 [Bacteroidota bacterium]